MLARSTAVHAVLFAALLVAGAPAAPAASPAVEGPVVIAVLDTGILETHETFEPGQVVAWWDFTRPTAGVPSSTWDTRVDPYDDQGHGTAVASMAAGVNREHQTASHAPGTALAIGKIAGHDGTARTSTIAQAIRWAAGPVDADVISISFGHDRPRPHFLWGNLMDAIRDARAQGSLVLVSAGNNNFDTTLTDDMGASPHALVVGGANRHALWLAPAPQGTMDGEVTSNFSVIVASHADPHGYDHTMGTSFSTPLVAGMAAALVEASLAEGMGQPGPNLLEDLLKHAAEDTVLPPNLEGYGYLDHRGLARAERWFTHGAWPDQGPGGLVNELYVDVAADTVRRAWTGNL